MSDCLFGAKKSESALGAALSQSSRVRYTPIFATHDPHSPGCTLHYNSATAQNMMEVLLAGCQTVCTARLTRIMCAANKGRFKKLSHFFLFKIIPAFTEVEIN